MSDQYEFANTLGGSSIRPRPDMRCVRPYHRHVEIIAPARGSHHRAGQIYVQAAQGHGATPGHDDLPARMMSNG